MSTSFSIFLDKRRLIERTQKYPIKLRVTHNRKSREFETVFESTSEDFDKLKAPRVSEEIKTIKDALNIIKGEVSSAINSQTDFNFWIFARDYITEHRYFVQKKFKQPEIEDNVPAVFDFTNYHKRFKIIIEEPGTAGSIKNVFISVMKQNIEEARIGNALRVRDSYSSIKKFAGNAVQFKEISPSWLYRYEAWMVRRDRSLTTVGIHLRSLRTIFNEAHHLGIINKEHCYPFGRRKYLIPTGKKVKKALRAEDIAKLYFNVPSTGAEAHAKALWFFCYFGNGMNIKDLAHLKFENIHGDYFKFFRAKTRRSTRTNPKYITAYINEDMRNTMLRYGNPDTAGNNYIFDCLNHDMNELEAYAAVPRLTRWINEWMVKIGKRVDLVVKPTTVVTRHSFATIMKLAGTSTEFIQESLGHFSITTTENYLDSFEDETKKTNAQSLLAFKQIQKVESEHGAVNETHMVL